MNNVKARKLNVREITIVGVLSAISIMLGVTPLGFIPLGPVSATTMHIPVIIGGIVEGPFIGGLVGLMFGIFSVFQAITRPGPVSFVFLNPLIAIVPRVLIGIVSSYCYNFLKTILKDKNKLAVIISAMLGSLVNTVGVLSGIYFFFGRRYMETLGLNPLDAKKVIGTIAITNGIPEAVLASLIVSAIVIGLSHQNRRR